MCHSNANIRFWGCLFKGDLWNARYVAIDSYNDNDSLFRTAAAGAEKVILSKLAWSVPIVQPNDVRKVNLYKSIAANNVIPVSFRMRQCETFS